MWGDNLLIQQNRDLIHESTLNGINVLLNKSDLSYFGGVLAFFDVGQVRKRTPEGLLKLYFIVAGYNNRILKAWLEYMPLCSHTKENEGRKI